MAFGLERIKLKNTLNLLGADVVDSTEKDNVLVVNNTYEICYTNFRYNKIGETETQVGKQKFLDLIKNS